MTILANWFLRTGVWDDAGEWADAAFWDWNGWETIVPAPGTTWTPITE
jgi:hypothetical protein